MRFLSFCLFILIPLGVVSQEKRSFSVDMNLVSNSSVSEKVFDGSDIQLQNDFIPLFFKEWKKNGKSTLGKFSIENTKEVILNKTEIGALAYEKLPSLLTSSLRVVKEGPQEYLSLEFYPLYKKENGKVAKVVSFDIEYELNKEARVSAINKIENEFIDNSVLSSGTWYKIAVDKTGVFKMDASFLKSIGIDTGGINPKKIRVFGNGGNMLPELLNISRDQDLVENAIYVSGESDGAFNNNDYVLFYAQGPLKWELNSKTDIKHQQNIYSNYGYYFINVDSGIDGQRIATAPQVNQTTTKVIQEFTYYKVHERELFNYVRVGRQWFGEDFSIESSQDFTFNFDNIITTTPVKVEANFSSNSAGGTSYKLVYDNLNETKANQELFSRSLFAISGDIQYNQAYGSVFFSPELASDITINVSWDNGGDLSAQGRLDYIRVIADRTLTANGKQFGFVSFDSKTDGTVLEYAIANKGSIDFVWDITNFKTPRIIQESNLNTTSTDFRFKEATDGNLSMYQLVNINDAYVPVNLGIETRVANQNLHGLQDIQYIIITTPQLKSQAERLAEYHKNNTQIDGEPITVEVIELGKIYNEFGSGASDITAIRDFAKYVYNNASSESKKLKYLCLFGDASFDYKQIIYKDSNLVPLYLSPVSTNLISSYNSDDYYGFLDETDDIVDNQELSTSGKLDITTGRIPVRNATLAKQYVDKLLNYYSSNSFGSWKTKITLLGDDGQHGDDQSLIRYLEESALKIEKNNKNVNLLKLYSDAYIEQVISGGGQYPQIVKRFDEAFNTGSAVINYFGHGNTSLLGEENFLDIPTIRGYRNLNNLPLFITVTCDFSRFDDPTIVSAGEELIESRLGGAASMITTSREIFIISGRKINEELADYMFGFDGKERTVAEALKDTKNNLSIQGEFFVYFFGDPAMKLPVPEDGIEVQDVKKVTINPETEEEILENVTELQGLSRIRVKGKVVQKDSVLVAGKYSRPILTNFNGNLSVTLFDKEIERETLLNEANNSGRTPNPSSIIKFKSLENKVFVGDATINNGEFTFDFVLPKDVTPLPENAKFSFYASSNQQEKTGSNFTYKVGGIDANAEEDNTPPVISLFVDNESFINGGVTGTTPTLIAKLEDQSGINTSLNSLGHSISLIIDGDLTNPIVLNEYYATEKDDFTKGIVIYELPELLEGDHTISLKVWDSHNNSSIQTLNFYAEANLKFKIDKVLNYPNPFTSYTQFWFQNNRKKEPLDIKVQVYTLSGKLVKTIRAFSSNRNDTVKAVSWDGKDDFGNKLGKGVYFYKLIVKENISGQTDEKIEKLVIL